MLKKIRIRVLLLLLVCIILQTTFTPYLAIRHTQPDVCSAFFISMLVQFPVLNAIHLAFFIGIVKELFSNHFFGLEIIALLIPAALFPLLIRKADLSNRLVKYAIIYFFLLIHFTVMITAVLIIEKSYHAAGQLYSHVLGMTLYTTVITFGIEFIVSKCIPRRTDQYELF